MSILENGNKDFEIGEEVNLKGKGLNGIVKDKIADLFMVELNNGLIDTFYSRQLEIR